MFTNLCLATATVGWFINSNGKKMLKIVEIKRIMTEVEHLPIMTLTFSHVNAVDFGKEKDLYPRRIDSVGI